MSVAVCCRLFLGAWSGDTDSHHGRKARQGGSLQCNAANLCGGCRLIATLSVHQEGPGREVSLHRPGFEGLGGDLAVGRALLHTKGQGVPEVTLQSGLGL